MYASFKKECRRDEMFGFFKKKESKESGYVLGSPVKGKAVPLTEVNDPTFAQEMLGKGVAVIPSEGRIFAPADGKVDMVFDTLHAVSMVTDFGAEILIHLGLDTVKMKGEGFQGHVKSGDQVKKGDLLLELDLEKVKAAGYDTITPMIVCNTPDYASVEVLAGKEVAVGDDVAVLTK